MGLDKEGRELAEALQLGAARVAEVLSQSLGKLGFQLCLTQSATGHVMLLQLSFTEPSALFQACWQCWLLACLLVAVFSLPLVGLLIIWQVWFSQPGNSNISLLHRHKQTPCRHNTEAVTASCCRHAGLNIKPRHGLQAACA